MNLRKKLGLVVGSLQLCAVYLASFFPSNVLRIAFIRINGAEFGSGGAVHHGLQVRLPSRLTVGRDCFIAEDVTLDARGGLRIGSHVSINSGAQIWTAQHDWRSVDFEYVAAPVSIGDRAWISARVIILPGVTIGEGAVLAAGTVVTKDVSAWTVVGGIPAKKIADRPVVNEYELNARENKAWWW